MSPEVLLEPVAVWRQEGVPFYVLLAGEASALGSGLPFISG
jgi:hypothetical protein